MVDNNDNLLKIDNKNYHNPTQNLTLNDLAKLIIFKFGSFAEFGKKLHVTRQRVNNILRGKDIPRTPITIKKIAEVLEIDAVVLSQLFSNVLNKNLEVEDENKNRSSS